MNLPSHHPQAPGEPWQILLPPHHPNIFASGYGLVIRCTSFINSGHPLNRAAAYLHAIEYNRMPDGTFGDVRCFWTSQLSQAMVIRATPLAAQYQADFAQAVISLQAAIAQRVGNLESAFMENARQHGYKGPEPKPGETFMQVAALIHLKARRMCGEKRPVFLN